MAQSLYEKKFITYPRTGSVALEESLVERTKKVLNVLKRGLPFENDVKFTESKRIFNNSKVEGHSAIIPTYIKPSNLTKEETVVYDAIKNRFLMQFMPVAEYDETKITVKIIDESIKGVFICKGRVQVIEGWRIVEKIDTKDTVLPVVHKEERVNISKSNIVEVTRKPPKQYTEKTLLRVMETCGKSYKDEEDSDEMMASILSGFSIGTPATRAETIKKLKDIGYIEAKGKKLMCTDLGRTIVEIFPVRELLDLEYTGRLEKTLSDIEKKKVKKDEFLNLIKDFTINAVNSIKSDTSFWKKYRVELPKGVESIGSCPFCGNPVVESDRAFSCSNWKNGCKFVIWKNDKYIESFGKKVSKEMVEILLKNGKVGFRNLKSKKGNTFAAYFRLELDEKTGKYMWKMEFI